MTRPVLIGATGQVGRRLTRIWRQRGVDVVTLGRGGDVDVAWDMDAPAPPVPSARGAAIFVLARAGKESEAASTALALRGVEAARSWRAAHCFVLSSSAVYGETGARPVAETAIPRPTGAYGHGKLAMEAATRGPGVTALRLCNVAGASQPFLAIARGGTAELDRFDDGAGPSRSFVGPVQLARLLAALSDLAAQGAGLPGLLNVAAPEPVAMAAIFEAAGHPFTWRPAPAAAIQHVHLDTARLAALVPLTRQEAPDLLDEARRTEE